MCKQKTINKSEDLKLVSTAPVCDEEKFGTYADIIQQQVNAVNVFNIGIIATYGAGKSSLIKTFKENRLSESERNKVTTISLANFNSPNDETIFKKVDGNSTQEQISLEPVKDIECDIEKSILEQFIFKESKFKLPHSRIKRIDNRHFWFSVLIAIMMTATIGLVCCGVLECLKQLPFSNGNNFFYFFGFAAGCVVLLIFMLLYSNRLNKITVKDIEADICVDSNHSVLNIFIDEILYYFKATKTNIVIIEDLDRFDNTHIFSKLRELNFLINNSKIVKQKVTFIYAVKDTLFTTEDDRAKFFDYIISLVPILSFTNSRYILENEIKKLCPDYMQLPDSYIKEVSHFITDMRILKNIINDYITYYKILDIKNCKIEDKNIKLFSLILYKNLRPSDYAELQFNKGKLANIFKNKQEKINAQSTTLKNEIVKLEKKLALAKDIKLNSFATFKSFIKGMIIDANQNSRYSNNVYKNIDSIDTFKDLDGGLYVNIYNRYQCTISELEEKLGDTLFDFEKRIAEKAAINLDNINSELTKNRKKLKELFNTSMQEFLNDNESFVTDELESFLLKNGFIAEDYKDFVAHADQDLLSTHDSEFVRAVLAKRVTDYGFKLDNPLNVIQEIQPERFSDKYVLNYDLVNYLLSYDYKKTDILNKRDSLIKYLNSREDTSKKFIKDFILNNYDAVTLSKALIPNNRFFAYDILTNDEVDESYKFELIKILIKEFSQNEIVSQNHENCIGAFINSYANVIDEIAIIDKSKLINLAVALNLKIEDIQCSKENYELANKIVLHNSYAINANNLEFIVCSLNQIAAEQYYQTPLSEILNIQNSSFQNLVSINIQEIIKIIVNLENQTVEPQETLEFVLNNKLISIDLCKTFIDKQSIRYNVFDCGKIECLEYMFNTDKITVDWDNVIQADKNELNWEVVLDFIIRHAEEFGNKTLSDKDLIIDLCNDDYFEDLKDFDKISKSFNVDLDIADINEDEILAILIKNNIINSNEQNFILLNNKPVSIVSMLLKRSDLVSEIKKTTFNKTTIEAVLFNNELGNELKSQMIANSSYIPESQQAIDAAYETLNNCPLSKCPFTLLSKIIKNSQLTQQDKLSFVAKNDLALTKDEYINLLIEIEPNLNELKSLKEIKLGHDEISNDLLVFIDNKKICKFAKYSYGVKITKKN